MTKIVTKRKRPLDVAAQRYGSVVVAEDGQFITYVYDEYLDAAVKKNSILWIPIQRIWFDMIYQNIKKTEYRTLGEYWAARLTDGLRTYKCPNCINGIGYDVKFRNFERVRLVNGYQTNRPVMDLEFVRTSIDTGNPDWGADPGVEYFCIDVGERLGIWNYG